MNINKNIIIKDEQYEINYDPPKEHGLSNSDFIIPLHYQLHKHPSKILDIDYYQLIKDDIKNYRTLNKYQLQYIKELSREYKNELFDIFNKCIDTLIENVK